MSLEIINSLQLAIKYCGHNQQAFKKVVKIIIMQNGNIVKNIMQNHGKELKSLIEDIKFSESQQQFIENLELQILFVQTVLVKFTLKNLTQNGEFLAENQQDLIKSVVQKVLSNKANQNNLININQKNIIQVNIVRSLCHILSISVTFIPISGIDIMKTLQEWFRLFSMTDKKELFALQYLLKILQQLLGVSQKSVNQTQIQFTVRLFQDLASEKFSQPQKLFMYLELFKEYHELQLLTLFQSVFKYLSQGTQDQSAQDEKIYFSLLKLPLTKVIENSLLTQLRAQVQSQKFQFLIYLIPRSIKLLIAKLKKSSTTRVGALNLLKFFEFGYQMQPKYFIDYCDDFIQILENLRADYDPARDREFTQEFANFLTVSMNIHMGHPEKYIEIQDRIGELTYDNGLLSLTDEEIEKIKTSGLWTSLQQQQTLQNFENNQAQDQDTKSEGKQEKKSEIVPKRFKGLLNLGNTCYMNSFLQALYQIKEFRSDLISLEDTESQKQLKIIDKVKMSLFQLQRLYSLIYGSVRTFIEPKQFRISLPDFFKNYEQHDCSEFAKLLLDKIERESIQCESKNIIREHLIGEKINQIQCLTCNNVSEQKEDYIDFSVNFQESSSSINPINLQEMIEQSFNEEVFEGDNLYYCNFCDCKVERAVKRQQIQSLPNYLIVTINRFFFDVKSLSKLKIMKACEVSTSISINKHLTQLEENVNYDLQSVIIHSGRNANFGHYYTITKDQDDEKWRIFNDASVTEIKDVSYLEMIQKKFENDTPYIVIYKKIQNESQNTQINENQHPQAFASQDVDMTDESQSSKQMDEHQENNPSEELKENIDYQIEQLNQNKDFQLPPKMQEFVDKDNKAYHKEQSKLKDQKSFNFQFYKELQKSISQMQQSSAKEIDENYRKHFGGGQGFGGPSMGAGGFFGGSGFGGPGSGGGGFIS
eukprot:403345967